MANPICLTAQPYLRLFARLLVLAALLLSVALGASQTRDAGKQKRGEEEEEKPGAVKNKPPPDVEESIRTAVPEDKDFFAAARSSQVKEIKELYEHLAIRGDSVELRNPSQRLRVEPLPAPDEKRMPRGTKTHLLDAQGKPGAEIPLDGRIVKMEPYEETVRHAVQKFLGLTTVNREEQLAVAERILTVTLRVHESWREQKKRQGDSWDPVQKDVRKLLMNVLVDRLKNLATDRKWDEAFDLIARLRTISPRNDEMVLAEPMAQLLDKATKDPLTSPQRIVEGYRLLRRLTEEHPGSEIVKKIREKLEKRAEELFRQAEAQEKTDPAASQALLQQAVEIFPDLKGLREARLVKFRQYPILRVGVRRLPQQFSPARAVTDPEKRAVELLFESLVRYAPDDHGVWSYRSSLAEGRPRLVPGGRQFQMPANAAWSNGKPLIRADVKETVDTMIAGKPIGVPPAWGELLQQVVLAADGNASRVEVTLRQGWPEPLSLMTFKVLPRASALTAEVELDSEQFAKDPICSGPYMVGARGSSPTGRPYVALIPNPMYGQRAGAANRIPPIKEIHFIEYGDPVAELSAGQLDLALDLTAEEAARLRAAGVKVPTPDQQAPNRRIYFFLANAQSKATGLENAALRRAIAYAIDRETLLDGYFRKPLGRGIHKAINGPFPPGSWAANPALEKKRQPNGLDFFDPETAKTAFNKEFGGKTTSLKVSYPSEDLALKAAVEALCQSVNDVLQPKLLVPNPRPERELEKDIAKGQYDLAYSHYDFPDETFWLGPLLGPQGMTGGEGTKVQLLLKKSLGSRDPTQLRSYAHQIHAEFLNEEMPMIPLWQLDPLIGVRSGVTMPVCDPWLVLTDLDRWAIPRE